MSVNPQTVAAMRAITISREYGSGGGEIAARLARQLGWQLIDHAIIEQTSRELNVHVTEVVKHDEEYVEGTRSGILDKILEQMAPSAAMAGGGRVFQRSSSPAEIFAYQETMRAIITAAATTGHVVIVGRGGQVLLAGQRDVLHIRVVAPLEQRVAYVVRREGLDPGAARKRVQAKDQARTRYMQTQYHCQHEDSHLYDLVLNTAVLDLDSAVDQISLALEGKARRLGVAVEQLGPAAGLAPYPGRAADFRTPG
jgi:cytidylate kinase